MRFDFHRPPERPPDRHAANWLLVAAVCVLTFHVPRLPLWLSLVGAAVIAWRFCIENRGWRVPGRWLRWPLAAAVLFGVFVEYETVFGRDAGMTLLSALVVLKVLETKTVRDYFVVVFLLYFLTLGAFLFDQSLSTGGWATVCALVVTYTLVRLSRPAALGGAQAWGVAGLMMVQAVPFMVVTYLLFPRIQGSLWGLPVDAFSGRSGLPQQIRPGSISRLALDDSVAFRVSFAGEPPANAQLYWRSLVLSASDGTTWRRAGDRLRDAPWWPRDSTRAPLGYTLTLEPHRQRWLPILELAPSIPAATRRRPGYTLETLLPVQHRAQFELSVFPDYVTGELSAAQRARQLRYPLPGERVSRLAQSWLSLAPEQRVAASLDYFRQKPFRYTLAPPRPGQNPLEGFLFETRAGYCEHYASAFVALMRLAGVPARLVVGYQGGAWNGLGSYLIVRQSDAHAWAEVWLADGGWTRVDPTAAVAPERVELGHAALRRLLDEDVPLGSLDFHSARLLAEGSALRRGWRAMALAWDSVNNGWNRWVMAYGPENQLRFLRRMGVEAPGWRKLVAGCALAAILSLLVLAAWTWRPRRRDRVVVAWDRYCARMSRRGLPRPPQEGPLDYRARVLARHPELTDVVDHITSLYVSLRYGRGDSTAVTALERLVRSV